jgi:hypothetical protein
MGDLIAQITKLNNILAGFEARLSTIENGLVVAGQGLQYFTLLLYVAIGLISIHFFVHLIVVVIDQYDR